VVDRFAQRNLVWSKLEGTPKHATLNSAEAEGLLGLAPDAGGSEFRGAYSGQSAGSVGRRQLVTTRGAATPVRFGKLLGGTKRSKECSRATVTTTHSWGGGGVKKRPTVIIMSVRKQGIKRMVSWQKPQSRRSGRGFGGRIVSGRVWAFLGFS